MFDLNKLVRPNIRDLQPYSSARDEYQLDQGIFLDANENPFGTANRYPDGHQIALKNRLAFLKNISVDQLYLGNGSDEIIDLCFRIFCEPAIDEALTFVPTYGMYKVASAIQNIRLNAIALNDEFQIEWTKLECLSNENLKLIFICSPNNPTGNNIVAIENILQKTDAIVVIDEAYIDFSEAESWIDKVNQYPNLIVLQTLSKAWGLAAARIGIAIASPEIIRLFDKVKPPYNIGTPNQLQALQVLSDVETFEKQKTLILKERQILLSALAKINFIKKVYPSDANFILIEVDDADVIYQKLIQQQIIIRNRNKQIPNALRITVGTPSENQRLLEVLNQIQ